MKDHTPIKRLQALVSFSRDHHFGLLLVWKIKQGLANAIAPERISNYVLYFFEEDLQPHFTEEEQTLFPKLPVDNVLRQRAEKEHAVIYDMINQLRNDRRSETLLLQFAETLRDHIRFEERELFASIQQTLSDAELEMIATHVDNRGNKVDAQWQDVFWVPDKSGL
ncbi:hemerythrin domain-containing protein [Terrimonas alba]|uniref:hemerythrin domain-containing protein n=1 Tax=Terrimonas alba TaxID=3349636 RepID=UPI0035F41BB0